MILTVRFRFGTGTLLNPTFKAIYVTEKIVCSRMQQLGNLVYLYDGSGYVIRAIDPNSIIKKED